MSKGDASCNLEKARQLPIDFNCRRKISEILNEHKKHSSILYFRADWRSPPLLRRRRTAEATAGRTSTDLSFPNIVESLPLLPLKVAGYRSVGGAGAPGGDSGLLGVDPETGAERWRRPLYARPLRHDCSLIDADGDGEDDCVVVGEKGMLAVMEPQQGKLFKNKSCAQIPLKWLIHLYGILQAASCGPCTTTSL